MVGRQEPLTKDDVKYSYCYINCKHLSSMHLLSKTSFFKTKEQFLNLFSIHPSPATAGNDDFFATVQNVTFQPGETRKQIEIEVVDDQWVEPTESFVLSLASSSPAILGEPSSVNIIDNDGKYYNLYIISFFDVLIRFCDNK